MQSKHREIKAADNERKKLLATIYKVVGELSIVLYYITKEMDKQGIAYMCGENAPSEPSPLHKTKNNTILLGKYNIVSRVISSLILAKSFQLLKEYKNNNEAEVEVALGKKRRAWMFWQKAKSGVLFAGALKNINKVIDDFSKEEEVVTKDNKESLVVPLGYM